MENNDNKQKKIQKEIEQYQSNINDVNEALTLVDFDEDDNVRVYFPDMTPWWEIWSRNKLREKMEETNSIRIITEAYLNEYSLEIQIKDYPYPVAFIPTIKRRVRELLQHIQEYALENKED